MTASYPSNTRTPNPVNKRPIANWISDDIIKKKIDVIFIFLNKE